MLLIDEKSLSEQKLYQSFICCPGIDELTKQKAQQPGGGGASRRTLNTIQ